MRVLDARSAGAEAVASAAARVVRDGGLVVFPTDTVYGIGADPHAPGAVERIYAAKNRPRGKPLALHLATVAEFAAFARDNADAMLLAERLLPGPLTVIVRRPAAIPAAVTAGFETLGLRVPDHDLCRAILAATGPLAATSANLSGSPAYTGSGDTGVLPDADLAIENGPTTLETESTVIDVSESQARIVRAGAIPTDMLEQILGKSIR